MSANADTRRLLPLLVPLGDGRIDEAQAGTLARPAWSESACTRGLGPTFYVFLQQNGLWALLPSCSQERLELAYRTNLAHYVVRESVLREVLSTFGEVGCSPILLKGLAFACELYPEPAARLSGDIDLLIESGCREVVHQQLVRSGFRLLAGSARARPVQSADDVRESVYLCRSAGHDILLEIHHQLINLRFGGGKEAVFRSRDLTLPRTRTIRIPAGEVHVLDHPVAFVHALRHIALHHRFIGFRWHHDLALMLVSWGHFLDPVAMRQHCRSINSEKMLDVELALLSDLFGRCLLSEEGWHQWGGRALPWEYALYRHIARGGRRTPWRELVRTLLAPSLRQQIRTLS